MDWVFYSYKNFESTVNENYEIITKSIPESEKIFIKASRSFKVLNEVPIIVVLVYNIFPNLSEMIQLNFPILMNIFKILKPNPFKNQDNDTNKKAQINMYEDYLYTITKLEYLITFLLKVNEPVFESLLKKYDEDIVKAIMHVLDNTPKDNIQTRKEILSITKNLIKPFSKVFYEKNLYFRNEENLVGKSVFAYDFISYEVNKIIFTLIDSIQGMMSFEEKLILIEELIYKINNYKIGYEFKLFIFYYITTIVDHQKTIINQDSNAKAKLIKINHLILKELGYFFDTLEKIFNKLDNYFVFNFKEKDNKYSYLDKNIFDLNTDTLRQPDLNNIQQTNIHKVYELILNNEYEKFINPEETKFIVDLLKHSNALLKVCVTLLNAEYMQINNQNSITHNYNLIGMPNNQMLNLNQQIRNDLLSQSISINIIKTSSVLRSIFKSIIRIYENIFKNHTHSTNEDNTAKVYEINLINIYVTLPPNICLLVFHKLMPFIFKSILSNAKICPGKNCLLPIIIDTIFETQNLTLEQNQHTLRKELFDIFIDYFISKIHYIGNNLKTYHENIEYKEQLMSVVINIFKSMFKCFISFTLDDKTKMKIVNFLVSCLILTKNSKFFGNYIYVIRCLFKNLLNMTSHSGHAQFEFYKETIHLVYGVMKLMINIKEEFPFLKEMLTEIIMIFPIKFKYMIEYAKIVFPSLLDALNMNQEIIPVGLQYLEQWMNALFHKPENVKPFLQNNINLLTSLLTSHLYKNYAISLNSLKLLSKFGGRSRNYLEDKSINPKTSPTNILLINLYDNNSNKTIELPIDNIVDLCIKIVTNYKRHYDKNWLSQIKISFKTLKACFLSFIPAKVDFKYIENIISKLKINLKDEDVIAEYNQRGYFKNTIPEDSEIKINPIYRKAEHFLIEKLLRGLFLCYTVTDIEGMYSF